MAKLPEDKFIDTHPKAYGLNVGTDKRIFAPAGHLENGKRAPSTSELVGKILKHVKPKGDWATRRPTTRKGVTQVTILLSEESDCLAVGRIFGRSDRTPLTPCRDAPFRTRDECPLIDRSMYAGWMKKLGIV
jgi:hypothetical protein